MGKLKKQTLPEIESTLVSNDTAVTKPRLNKLIIKNFRSIGQKPVEIELDDIVVLVGPNNVGKSSILKAYELVMNHGSNKCAMSTEDFPNGKIEDGRYPEIELQTIVYDNSPGEQWIFITQSKEKLVRERWIWKKEGQPVRQGFNVEKNDWDDKVPWGAPNIAKSRRPEPHRVNAFDPPEEQSKAITDLLIKILIDRIKSIKGDDKEKSTYDSILENVKEFQKKVVNDSQAEIKKVEDELSSSISQVFSNHTIKFDAKPEDNLDKAISLFKANPLLLMGPKDGYLSTIDRQGSGVRRTLLWTALRIITENQKTSSKTDETVTVRPNVLLLDEPEICLHPNAIRDACNVLYNLPKSGRWQVMVTTHSPAFIDISRDNTTIIRVYKDDRGDVQGTTVYRPSTVNLTKDDRENLKLLNIFDPYVAEFFFGGKTIIVEGDTEYTALKFVIAHKPESYKNVHIIRARGKATIVSLVKILNHFGSNFSVLHDSDIPTAIRNGKTIVNGAWTKNNDIMKEIKNKQSNFKVRLFASVPNFEFAFLGVKVDNEKPYNALLQLKESSEVFSNIEKLLSVLISDSKDLPVGCIEWNSIEQLKKELEEN
ncbi:MAG: AAA family ATPase [Ignavibacteriales bacterium]|nr:MAG: AAA family ATPase [Ignavibacteriales bacterium]